MLCPPKAKGAPELLSITFTLNKQSVGSTKEKRSKGADTIKLNLDFFAKKTLPKINYKISGYYPIKSIL